MVRVGVIGAGHWGPNLIRTFHSGGRSEVTAVVDSRPERLSQLRPRYPRLTLSSDPDVVLSSPDIDAVVIATPTLTHHGLCKRALEAGKHVLVEKPITTDAALALELDALARARRRVLMVGHVFLFNAAAVKVKQLVDEGAVGAVRYLSMVRTNLGPIRTDVSAAWDLASHDVALADWWLGATPLAVSATGGAWLRPGLHDTVFATLTYPKGVLVSLHCSWLNSRKARDITVVGERKLVRFDDLDVGEPLRIYDRGVSTGGEPPVIDSYGEFLSAVREGDVVIPKISMGEPLRAECEHFLDCVEQGRAPLTDAVRGAAVVKTLEAISKSVALRGAEVAL